MANSAPISLRDLQKWMRWILTDPRGVKAALAEPQPSDRPQRFQAPILDAQKFFSASSLEDLTKRLDVYSEGYFLRILDVLSDDYPHAKFHLKNKNFRQLIAQYLIQNPSTVTEINDVGLTLPDFCLQVDFDERLQFVPELCRVERLSKELQDLDDVQPLDVRSFENWLPEDWAQALLFLSPAERILYSVWPLDRLFQDLSAIERFTEPRPFVLRAAQVLALTPFEVWMFEHLGKGLTLAEVLNDLPEVYTESEVMTTFANWLECGRISRIEAKSVP